jgi:hypothetical protein
MAVTTVQTNNKLIEFTKQINREWVRDNLFSPYMGTDITAIIRKRMELTNGGEQMNIPMVARLNRYRDRLRHLWPATKSRSTTTACASGSTGLVTRSRPTRPRSRRTPPRSSALPARCCRTGQRN